MCYPVTFHLKLFKMIIFFLDIILVRSPHANIFSFSIGNCHDPKKIQRHSIKTFKDTITYFASVRWGQFTKMFVPNRSTGIISAKFFSGIIDTIMFSFWLGVSKTLILAFRNSPWNTNISIAIKTEFNRRITNKKNKLEKVVNNNPNKDNDNKKMH